MTDKMNYTIGETAVQLSRVHAININCAGLDGRIMAGYYVVVPYSAERTHEENKAKAFEDFNILKKKYDYRIARLWIGWIDEEEQPLLEEMAIMFNYHRNPPQYKGRASDEEFERFGSKVLKDELGHECFGRSDFGVLTPYQFMYSGTYNQKHYGQAKHPFHTAFRVAATIARERMNKGQYQYTNTKGNYAMWFETGKGGKLRAMAQEDFPYFDFMIHKK